MPSYAQPSTSPCFGALASYYAPACSFHTSDEDDAFRKLPNSFFEYLFLSLLLIATTRLGFVFGSPKKDKIFRQLD